jgi:phosphocarrier protein HPr
MKGKKKRMYCKTVEIINQSGLHARPASDFVKCAKQFKSKVMIKRLGGNDQPVNAKSIVSLLAQSLSKGQKAEISAEGEDEAEAVDALVEIIEFGFGE